MSQTADSVVVESLETAQTFVRSVSVVVPTYREAESLPHLVRRLEAVAKAHALDIELLIMDDRSDDGTPEVVGSIGAGDWVRLIVRNGSRGLSQAVIDGLNAAKHELLVVMDADLSHPPETIPRMLDALSESGIDFVIGSRYVSGGSTSAQWGLFRWLNSTVATLMARPFTSARDPMSGFFALRRTSLARADRLNPVGYKIGLELIVKCNCRGVREIPIHFADRIHGESKLTFREQLRYVRHLGRLLVYRVTHRRRHTR